MSSRMFLVIGWGVLVCAVGCGNPTFHGPPTSPVKGTVTIRNRPLPEGEIAFSIPGQPPRVLAIAGGAFAGDAFLGKNRVQIFAYKPGPPLSTDPQRKPTKLNTIAHRFNYQSTLSADVALGGSNDFKFDVSE